MTSQKNSSLVKQVIAGTPLSREQADWLIEVDEQHLPELFLAASLIRKHFVGDKVHCCSIAGAKVGPCSEDCAFCGQSGHYETSVKNTTVQLQPEEVFEAATQAAANGSESFGIVNSGRGPSSQEIEHWAKTIEKIRAMGTIRVCASLGILDEQQAQRLADAGLQRYNHNLQTSRRYYSRIVKTHDYDHRLRTLANIKSAGISICSGALFGMGETWADRIDLAFELREISPDVVPLNFLVPIPGTPLADYNLPTPTECLKITAIYRFLLPDKQIAITGGREVNLRDLQSWIFFAGANGFMLGNYLTTTGRSPQIDRQMIRDLGLELAKFHEGEAGLKSIRVGGATGLQHAT